MSLKGFLVRGYDEEEIEAKALKVEEDNPDLTRYKKEEEFTYSTFSVGFQCWSLNRKILMKDSYGVKTPFLKTQKIIFSEKTRNTY
jgi:hypothetical protein